MTFRPFATAALAGVAVTAGLALAFAPAVRAHGDVTPQQVDVTGLDPVGEEWRTENPYKADNKRVLEVGASGYNQNCARCHGLQVISGGIAPDLRYLEKGKTGDEWFMTRIRRGAKKPDGVTMMPAFEGLIQQEAMWAIRTYIETLHQE